MVSPIIAWLAAGTPAPWQAPLLMRLVDNRFGEGPDSAACGQTWQ